VGYKNSAAAGQTPVPEEWYFVDAEWPSLGKFDMAANDRPDSQTGTTIVYPGNRTLSREEFRSLYITKFYFPAFRTQALHDAWYEARMTIAGRAPMVGAFREWMLSGTYDLLRG
jgi:hypothetical protein